MLERLAAGEIDILIGTHALFQDDVVYKDLAIAVIDEQHRFGVQQRLALQQKGGRLGANVLVMTATPIPRTLLMTHYGDLDVSRLTEKPAGRKPVTTVAMPNERIEEVLDGIRRALQAGAQVYWVCPLVEGSDKLELAAAEERFAHLQQHFGTAVGMVHGQMKGPEKDAVMAAFSADGLKILVSTTVIEVGVNVPNASIMVIEHAERFGLAQLHQLRGRVGRGSRQSSCVLLYAAPLGETAKDRLKTMCDTEDGFVIAEKDLKLRGGGEVLGTRQSGAPEFRIANVPNLDELLEVARADARLVLERDPNSECTRGRRCGTCCICSSATTRCGCSGVGDGGRWLLRAKCSHDVASLALFSFNHRQTASVVGSASSLGVVTAYQARGGVNASSKGATSLLAARAMAAMGKLASATPKPSSAAVRARSLSLKSTSLQSSRASTFAAAYRSSQRTKCSLLRRGSRRNR